MADIITTIRQIKNLRQLRPYFTSIQKNPMVTLTCAGGCGYTHRVRLSRIRLGDVFICDRKATRQDCRAKIPHQFGNAPEFHHQQAGAMCGVTWARPVLALYNSMPPAHPAKAVAPIPPVPTPGFWATLRYLLTGLR